MRLRDPLDLDFNLYQEHIPDSFLKTDIKKHGNRHLVQQLAHLSKAKQSKELVHRWYILVSQASIPATVYNQLIYVHRRSWEASSTSLCIDVWKKVVGLS